MTRISIIHSLGDIWAMGSKPKYALLNIILPEASKSIQANWLEEIMDAANLYLKNPSLSVCSNKEVIQKITNDWYK